MRGKVGGGVESQSDQTEQVQALPDSAILQLASLGARIETLYGFPQDIEWGWQDGELFILQSRPITSLYPIPEQDDSTTNVYFSFGAVQGVLDPMTPLGQDAIRLIFVGGASLFNIQVTHKTQGVIFPAGNRLWAKVTGLLRNPIGSRIIPRVFPGIEPGSLPALMALLKDPKIGGGSGKIRLRTIGTVTSFMFRMQRKALHNIRNPEEKAAHIKTNIDEKIARFKSLYTTPQGDHLPLAEIPKIYLEIRDSFPFAVPEIATGVLAGLLPMLLLNRLAKQSGASTDLVLELTRGLPNNPTTEMDLVLWATAKAIKHDPESLSVITQQPAAELASTFLQRELPPHAQTQIQNFLEKYGMRGLAEIDIGRPRWRENPTPIIQTIQSYLKIEDEASMPDAVFERGAIRAAETQAELEQAVLKTHGGKLKAKVVRAVARRVRALGGLRESPKFYIIQLMGIIRKEMLKTGQVLVEQGQLTAPDDLFFLYLDELEAFARGEQGDWKALIEEHRQAFQREMRRRQVPRLLVSDGRTFYEGLGESDADPDGFRGSPVSPGIVEGQVRVVLDPHVANLLPGEILVCPATDPAWTPLFLAAGGLIMETGGLMTHGAIVAREYGIPAVVGVNEATLRLKTGDQIRLDGTTGLIEKLN
jgi:pyruvate,water dikinase